ncbi:peptide ABC transporter substrate-binding protein [Chloroflexia bacterium SDU3-3]|nr:peptide ABC transporter substrate-binding protein [Chloroflexia bacterium SDU3-3]
MRVHTSLAATGLALTTAILLASCGAAPTTQAGAASSTAAPAPGSGQGDTLHLLWLQAPTILNPHLATGTKDFDASRVTYEPLASFDQDGSLVPFLAAEIPSRENGGLAADGKSVTWKLKAGVKWSDGEPFTAEDVKFTYDFLADKATAATTTSTYSAVSGVEVIDPTTVKVRFRDVSPAWSLPFVGTAGLIIPKHIFQGYVGAKAREAPANLKPVGTGPYRVVDFKPGDIVVYEPNPYFREQGKPFFARVELKGGGDPTSAARAVLQTGEVDFTPGLSAAPQVLEQLKAGGKGLVVPASLGGFSERIELNYTDPNAEVDGERSSLKAPHPFFSDSKVRQAFALAVDRTTIAAQVYGPSATPITNAVVEPPTVVSPNTKAEYNLQKAAALLDEAGWKDTNGDGVREKNGVALSILYQTSIVPARQKTQEVIKQALESIGFKVELKSVDNGIFFGSDPNNTDNFNHFYADVQVYTIGNNNPDPGAYLESFTCAKIAQKANSWSGSNRVRYCNPHYDELFQKSTVELDPAKRQQLFIQLNDLLISDVAIIPLVKNASNLGVSSSLEGTSFTPWDSTLWQIKDWRRKAS